MPEGGADEISRAKMIHIDIAGYLGDAVMQEELVRLGVSLQERLKSGPREHLNPMPKG